MKPSKDLRIEKARKRLARWRNMLNGLREDYVENERNNILTANLYSSYLGGSIKDKRREEILLDMKEVKEWISKFERIAL